MTSKISARNSGGQKAVRAEWLSAVFNGVLEIFTAVLVVAAFLTIREAHRASSEQLGVQTWLRVDPKFDSKELKLARKHLAQQLDPYVPRKESGSERRCSQFF